MADEGLLEAILKMPLSVTDGTSERDMELFWRFIHERQEIFKKRYIDKLPRPWTNDPILRDYKFTNVYRELDRGTLYYLDNVIDDAHLANQRNDNLTWEQRLIFFTLVYRHFNWIPTWEAISEDMRDDNIGDIHKTLWNLPRVYTNAHNVTGVKWADSPYKVDNSHYLIQVWRDNIVKIADAVQFYRNDMGRTWEYFVKSVLGIGGFTAYEVVVDFSYTTIVDYDDDAWVNPGPGCRRGLNRLFPGLGNNLEVCRNKIIFLRESQKDYFQKYGLDFYFWQGQELTLRNIEHCLCEFSKYAKAYYREGRPRNNFIQCSGSKELVYVE